MQLSAMVLQLLSAARNGHEAVVRQLLENGADIEAKNMYGWTALHWTAFNGHETVVRLLLEKGADLEAKNKDEQTALHFRPAKDTRRRCGYCWRRERTSR